MVIYVNDNYPPAGAIVTSDTANAPVKSPDGFVISDEIPVRIVRVDGAGNVLATTGYTCNFALGLAGATPMLHKDDMTAVTTPDGWQETIDFGDDTHGLVTWLGSATEPKTCKLCVAIYDASTNKRTIVLQDCLIYPKVL